MWPFTRSASLTKSDAPIFLTNTLGTTKQRFIPLKPGEVSLYTCGPTVYSQAHIGNLRSYIFSDTLARTLIEAGYHVHRVINITDVGHLTDDADSGEDKMEKGALEAGLNAQELADKYTHLFLADLQQLHIDTNSIVFPRATEYIKEQIAFIQELEKRGHTYTTSDGVYFDVSTFPQYGVLGNIKEFLSKEEMVASVGRRITENKEKHTPADFALWKLSPRNSQRQQEWSSPWGTGFPGWHIECSAMSKALLGEQIDIHTGGIDHIPVHHNDEIAQSEAVSGKRFATYWMHNAFISIAGDKIAKSVQNVVYLSELEDKGLHPLALRYLYLQAHYSSPLSFTWEAAMASNEALTRLWKLCADSKNAANGVEKESEARQEFISLLRNDLGTPQGIALLWDTLKSEEYSDAQKWALVVTADKHLGLSLVTPPIQKTLSINEIPADVRELALERAEARSNKDFARSDELRIHISKRGYHVDDSPSGPLFTPNAK
ncbi:cysteine--tRNA ligase [Patescibacteria group bacterium]|nr:cysteine--tRNA ligase [Patescibacteria group bacterium]MBU1755005.1 cysteine--tRNA ligase [Patescibacteria group bacterium]